MTQISDCESTLIHDVVNLISQEFPVPSSANMQIGYRLRYGILYRELCKYLTLYRADLGPIPDEMHLKVAGRIICKRFEYIKDWGRFPNCNQVLVVTAEFSQIRSATEQDLVSRQSK